ncbi:hypothetical protein Lal_00020906 [Lupinus albus]|nr:hypothetical protein Lal_00020906 [Lupinus albus]
MIKAEHVHYEALTNFFKGDGIVEVDAASRSGGRHSKVFTVKLTENWCDCRKFQSLRLSCSHEIVTCSTLNLDRGQFISPIYRFSQLVMKNIDLLILDHHSFQILLCVGNKLEDKKLHEYIMKWMKFNRNRLRNVDSVEQKIITRRSVHIV